MPMAAVAVSSTRSSQHELETRLLSDASGDYHGDPTAEPAYLISG